MKEHTLSLPGSQKRLRQWTKPGNHDLVLNAAMDLTRSREELILETMLLRQQLTVLKRRVKRPALSWRDRTLFVLLASKLPTWKQVLVIAQLLTLTERHLHRLMKEYGEYFDHARPHQGIEQRIPCQPVSGAEQQKDGELISRPVLGGLHHDYHWQSQQRPSFRRAA